MDNVHFLNFLNRLRFLPPRCAEAPGRQEAQRVVLALTHRPDGSRIETNSATHFLPGAGADGVARLQREPVCFDRVPLGSLRWWGIPGRGAYCPRAQLASRLSAQGSSVVPCVGPLFGAHSQAPHAGRPAPAYSAPSARRALWLRCFRRAGRFAPAWRGLWLRGGSRAVPFSAPTNA